MTAEETMEVWANLVTLTLLQGVALCASGLVESQWLLVWPMSSGSDSASLPHGSEDMKRTLKRLAPFLESPVDESQFRDSDDVAHSKLVSLPEQDMEARCCLSLNAGLSLMIALMAALTAKAVEVRARLWELLC